MKKRSFSRSAFFNPLILIGFVLCSVGLLALVGLSKSVTATSAAMGTAKPVPLINQPLVPDVVAPGGAGFTLTVNGTGFVSGSVVNWNGTPRTTSFVNGSQLTASLLSSDIATASTGSVTVVTPAPGGGTSNVAFFPITVATSDVTLSRADLAVGTSPQLLAAADFDGDGNVDLAVPNYGGNISILLGNGDGTFRTHVDYATGANSDSVAVGDFNRDGKIDLAVANYDSNTISILLGNGDGSFLGHVDYRTGTQPSSVVVADLNADGKVDLATSDEGASAVSVLLGNGDGTFRRHIDYSVGVFPTQLKTGDFNTDEQFDLAVSNYGSNTVSILLGNGDGTFQSHSDYAVGSGPAGLSLADLDGDGILDLAITNQNSNDVSILVGNGDGTFKPHVDYAIGAGATRSDLADLNGDGKLDLAVINSSNALSILLGNGDATFHTPISFATGSNPFGVVSADFDQDGKIDVAVTNFNDNTVSILLQTPVTTQGCTPPPAGLVSWWSGDRTAEDVQGTNPGVLKNGASFTRGMVGPGFVFDGVNDYVQVGDTPSLKMTTAVTLECWIFPTGPGSIEGAVIANREGEYEIGRFLDGTIQWAFANTNPGWTWINTGFVAPQATWTHIAVTFDNGLITTYANGVQVHQYQGSGPIGDAEPTLNDFRIGNRQAFPAPLQAIVDELKVYNRALSSSEVAAIYAAGSSGNCKPDIFVASIDPSYTVSGHGFQIATSILIQDANSVGTNGASVQLGVILPSGSALTFPLKTDATGQADVSFTVADSGLYQFKVRNVSHPTREYDASLNIETTDTLVIP